MFPNRTICDVLEGMRKCCETKNFSYLPGLVEEAQVMSDRMESALSDKKDYKLYHEERSKLCKEIEILEAKKDKLKEKDEDATSN